MVLWTLGALTIASLASWVIYRLCRLYVDIIYVASSLIAESTAKVKQRDELIRLFLEAHPLHNFGIEETMRRNPRLSCSLAQPSARSDRPLLT